MHYFTLTSQVADRLFVVSCVKPQLMAIPSLSRVGDELNVIHQAASGFFLIVSLSVMTT